VSEVKQHWVEVEDRVVKVFGNAKLKVPFRIEVGIEACDPLKLEREYPEGESDWLASQAANEGARMAAEGFWYSDDGRHLFIPAHRITYVQMEKEGT
jgi:hypothetical protein